MTYQNSDSPPPLLYEPPCPPPAPSHCSCEPCHACGGKRGYPAECEDERGNPYQCFHGEDDHLCECRLCDCGAVLPKGYDGDICDKCIVTGARP